MLCYILVLYTCTSVAGAAGVTTFLIVHPLTNAVTTVTTVAEAAIASYLNV